MKRKTFLIAILSLLVLTSGTKPTEASHIVQSVPNVLNVLNAPVSHKTYEWNCFIEALIYIESRGVEDVIGDHDAIGVLQITPIIIREANRISGYEKYADSDRFDRAKSIEIFNLIQEYYNPEKDRHLALKIWNSRAPLSYHSRIMNRYYELINNKIN